MVASHDPESSMNADLARVDISAATWTSHAESLSTTAPRAIFVSYMSGGLIHVGLDNHCAFVFPADRVQVLARARAIELRKVWIHPSGHELFWPRLQVGLSLRLLMLGVFGSTDWMCEQSRRLAISAGQGSASIRKARVPNPLPIVREVGI
jgi:hypothetical protein